MNTHLHPRALVATAILASLCFASEQVNAANLLWSANGTTLGGAGTWDTTTANRWGTNTTTFTTTWNNLNLDTAIFGGPAGTVTLGTPITVGGLTFNNSGYALSPGGNTLAFGAPNNTITFNTNNTVVVTATITGTVGGSGNVTLTAPSPNTAGTVTFNGISAGGWSGTTTINAAMTVSLTATNQALLNTSAISLNGGGITLTYADDLLEDDLDRVNNGAAITSKGGNITYTTTTAGSTKTFAETIGSVDLVSGQLNIVETLNKNNGSQTLTLSGLTRTGAGNSSVITFSNAGALDIVNDIIRVNGIATSTTAGQIIGPWATVGTTAAAQTDYAVYNSDGTYGRVVAAAIAGSAQTAWTTATDAYTLANTAGSAANGRLAATRNINALRNTTTATALTSVDTTLETITVTGSAFANGDVVVFGGTPPAGLTAGVPYYIVGASGATFSVATTSGGGAINLTSVGSSPTVAGGITLSSGNNLGTYGILNGSAATLAIGRSGTGAVTLPTTSSGDLYITAGNGQIQIDAPITDNGSGVLRLVKSGGATLTLRAANTFTGGLVINAGALLLTSAQSFTGGVTLNGGSFGADGAGITAAALNGNNITVNGLATMAVTGAGDNITGNILINSTGTLRLGNNAAIAQVGGVLSGSGTLDVCAIGGSGSSIMLTNTANTFTGGVIYSANNNGAFNLSVNSFADSASPGEGKIVMGNGGVANSQTFTFHTGAIAPLTFNNRQFELAANASGQTLKIANNSAQAFTINTDLLSSGTGNRTLTLGGTGAGLSTFAGDIANGSFTSLALTKADSGTWIISGNLSHSGGVTVGGSGTLVLSGNNTYSGTTTMGFNNPAGAGLIYQGMQALSPNTSLQQTHAGGVGGHGTFKLLDDSATPLSRSTVNLTFNQQNASQNALALFVGNNNTANGGNSAGTTTDSTIELGNMNFNQTGVGAVGGAALNVNGANNYKLQIAGVNVNLQAAYASAWAVRLLANASLIVTGNVQQAAGSAGTTTLQLDGTATGSEITGNILDSADGTPKILNLTKYGNGRWILSGNNTYSGVTTVSNGVLSINSIANVNGGASAVGAPTTAANGTIGIGSSAAAGTLLYTGTGHTSDRVINLAGTTFGATLDQSGTGLLKFTSAFTATGAGIKTLTLQGSTAGTGEIAGAIVNSSSATHLTKAGTGRWVLSGANTYTGITTLNVNGGVLQFAKQVSLYNNTPASWVKTGIIVNSGATLALNVGGTGEFTASDLDTLQTNLKSTINNNGFRAGSILGLDTSNATGGNFTYNTAIGNSTGTGSGAVGLTKLGTGKLTLGAAVSTYSGPTTVSAGELVVNGSIANSAFQVASGAILSGTGITGALSGSGLVSPGNSPGILTATQFDPAGGMDYGFEFTQLNDPTWSNASASGNDVQRLTHGTTPFGAGATPANLTAANVLNIYFNLALLTSGDVFRGGFFTDLNNDFTTAVGSATYNFFVLGDGNGTDATFNSVSYYSLANYDPNASINQTVVQVPSANFSGGTVLNGWVQQFEVTIIPEPSGIFLILCGALTMGWYYRRQRSV